jgi:hypothetical protein
VLAVAAAAAAHVDVSRSSKGSSEARASIERFVNGLVKGEMTASMRSADTNFVHRDFSTPAKA